MTQPGTASPTCTSTDASFAGEGPILTVEQLLLQSPFYVAHRGSGDNWTEHSMEAYSESAAHGVGALEVSVSATLDGVFICHHDTTLRRLTGDPRKISQVPFAEVGALRLDARQWLGSAAPLRPIPTLEEVLDKFASSHVIFIEDKQGTNTEALLDFMDTFPVSTEHFVWKQSARGAHTAAVHKRGYKIWGYFDVDQANMFAAVVPTLDWVGLSVDADDTLFRQLVDHGKPVIAWEVHTRSERDRLTALGVQGMMCSNVLYVCSAVASSNEDAFATGLRAAGDLPWALDKGWGTQPQLAADTGTISLKWPGNSSYLLGSLSPVKRQHYTLSAQLCWPAWLPGEHHHAGLAFGQEADWPYLLGTASAASGYHLVLQAGGTLELYSRQAGEVAGTMLGSVSTAKLQAREWVVLRVQIDPEGIRISRDDDPRWVLQVLDRKYRGGYLSVCKNYPQPLPVEFREIVIA
ncbi:glycerophosphodiester phosphodiesterase [Arthrobacter psychrochitiniphilus]|uniref:glycerophosphodiester phosphodiesterase n=1 Tax=Arthrobacter psychrochitiniphilus TaxID=291045 RepID=UPI003F7BECA4